MRSRCTSRGSGAGGTWERGGQNVFTSPMHKSETVDYGILLAGERMLVLDDGEHVMKPGDVVVQLGNWHGWTNPQRSSQMAFVMMGAKYEGVTSMSEQSKPVRRIVGRRRRREIRSDHGRAVARRAHRPGAPGILVDAHLGDRPRRPRASRASARPLDTPHTLEPPPGGSVCRVVTFPPDEPSSGKVGAKEVQAFFRRDGLAGRIHLFAAGAASLHAEDAHARFLPGARRRDHAGARHRRSAA